MTACVALQDLDPDQLDCVTGGFLPPHGGGNNALHPHVPAGTLGHENPH